MGCDTRESIEAACARRGRHEVVAGCIALLGGQAPDPSLVAALGGPGARRVLEPDAVDTYWLRVWATRGLLWAWDETATPAIRAALSDGHWRVREMAAKVVARHLLGDALGDVAAGRDDPNARVRAASSRAVAALTAAGA